MKVLPGKGGGNEWVKMVDRTGYARVMVIRVYGCMGESDRSVAIGAVTTTTPDQHKDGMR